MDVLLYDPADLITGMSAPLLYAECPFKRQRFHELIIEFFLFLGDDSPESGKALKGTGEEVKGEKRQKSSEPPGVIHIIKT